MTDTIADFMLEHCNAKLLCEDRWLMPVSYGTEMVWAVFTKNPYHKPRNLFIGKLEEALKILVEGGE